METLILNIHEGLDSQDPGSAPPDTVEIVSGSFCNVRTSCEVIQSEVEIFPAHG